MMTFQTCIAALQGNRVSIRLTVNFSYQLIIHNLSATDSNCMFMNCELLEMYIEIRYRWQTMRTRKTRENGRSANGKQLSQRYQSE